MLRGISNNHECNHWLGNHTQYFMCLFWHCSFIASIICHNRTSPLLTKLKRSTLTSQGSLTCFLQHCPFATLCSNHQPVCAPKNAKDIEQKEKGWRWDCVGRWQRYVRRCLPLMSTRWARFVPPLASSMCSPLSVVPSSSSCGILPQITTAALMQ